MRLVAVQRLEDCFDGSSVYSYRFDQAWTRPAIQRLGALGKLDYYADFPRPFYRVRGANGLQLKGIEGDAHWRVVLAARHHGDFQSVVAALLSAIAPSAGHDGRDIVPADQDSPGNDGRV